MEFITGVSEKKTVEISQILEGGLVGTRICVSGAIHRVRPMGEVIFVILRKAEGLLQLSLIHIYRFTMLTANPSSTKPIWNSSTVCSRKAFWRLNLPLLPEIRSQSGALRT